MPAPCAMAGCPGDPRRGCQVPLDPISDREEGPESGSLCTVSLGPGRGQGLTGQDITPAAPAWGFSSPFAPRATL